MKFLPTFALIGLLSATAVGATDEWLDRAGEALAISAAEGRVRVKTSGLLDLEAYRFSDAAPDLIDTKSKGLFNPRLTLLLDGQIGSSLYFFVQGRVDRGFDPSDDGARGRLDEYALRLTPWEDGRLSIQAGKFATVVGTWTRRHLSWDNAFITAPLPYGAVTPASDLEVPAGPGAFGQPSRDEKYDHLPVIWNADYATGLSVAGRLGKFDYAAELKNSPLGARPSSWNPDTVGFSHPTLSGRVAFRPSQAWELGVSVSRGAYLRPEVHSELPMGRGFGHYTEQVVGGDVSYAWHHWQFWGEVFATRYEVPGIGNLDLFAYYLEGKYKITPQLYAALRWNQMFYGSVRDEDGGRRQPSPDKWQVDAALGYRLTAHTQVKVQYTVQQGEVGAQGVNHTGALQVTVRF